MRVKVTANICEIQNDVILNSGEYNINKFYFDFSEEYIDNYVKKALFVGNDGTVYEMVIANGECDIPYEILENDGTYTFGVYAYELDNGELKLRYSPEPTHFYVNKGSYMEDGISPTQPTPDEFEQYYQAMQTLIANAKPELIDYIEENLPTIEIGSTSTLPEGSQATVENVGTERNPIFNFGIPKGDRGTTDYNELINKPDLTIYSTIDETANKIRLDINNQTYQVKAMIYDKNNILLSESNVIDLPLESVVVSGVYDSETKKIILTLENGNTIEIPLGDLVSGLQSEITEDNKLASDLVDDTESAHKFVTSSDKTSWTNKVGSISKNGVNIPIDANKNVNISVPTHTNDLINNSGFITNATDDLEHYYNKAESDTRFSLITETGYNLTLTIDPLTYIMTAVLKTRNNQILSTQSIDLPLETMVVGASYDSTTKEIVLTLKNGQEVRFSVADLVSGLQAEITEDNKLASDLVDDTNNTNKFVTAEEKTQITTNENDISDIKDEQEIQNEHLDELDMIYNAFPTVSAEDTTIQLDNTAKVKFREIDLKGNTSQVVIPEEQGTSVSNTSIYVSDVNIDKENTIEMGGNTYQANAILPSEYTQVDYLESDGNQYIDTGINADSNLRVVLDMAYTSPTSANQNVGAIRLQSGNTKRYHLLTGDRDGRRMFLFYYNDNSIEIGDADTDRHLFDFNAPIGKITTDNVEYNIPTPIADVTLNFYLFGRNSTSTIYMSKIKQWACKMYYSNILVRDFIPCYRNSDNEIGLYDLVNNVFYANQGTGAFTYGSVASLPNPDYPQNISVVTGTQNVEVCGKNLFDKNDMALNEYIRDDGTTLSSNYWDITHYIRIIPNETFTYNGLTTVGTSVVQSAYYDKNKNYISVFKQATGTNTITPPANAYYVRFSINKGSNDKDTFMIEKGSTATPYEAYTGTTYPVNLGDIELCKIGTYQDKIYKSNNKWYLYKEIDKVALNGTETVTRTATNVTGCYRFNVNIGSNIYSTDTTQDDAPFYCNKFVSGSRSKSWTLIDCIYPTNSTFSYGSFGIYYDATKEMTPTQFKNWLSQNGVVVYYPYATPTTTEITDTTLVNQLNALYNATIYPITNINTDTSNLLPYIDLHYNFATPSPSPNRPSVVNVVRGNNAITISNSDNTESQNYPINLGDMELCKIGTYQDYIYESNGNWFKKENIGKTIINGTETTIIMDERPAGLTYYSCNIYNNNFVKPNSECYCDKLAYSVDSIYSNDIQGIKPTSNGRIKIKVFDSSLSTDSLYRDWLSENNLLVYYVLNTSTDTQITDTALITQLNNIKKAYSYDTQTNISQTNTDKPFIIYAEAIDNNADLLTDYVKNTDYATNNVGGVVKVGANGISLNNLGILQAGVSSYSDYQSKTNNYFIGKGTLENIITGKDLTTKAYVDGLVGDVENLLETLDVGSGV